MWPVPVSERHSQEDGLWAVEGSSGFWAAGQPEAWLGFSFMPNKEAGKGHFCLWGWAHTYLSLSHWLGMTLGK